MTLNNSDPLGVHAGQYQNNYTEAESNQFASEFGEITKHFAAAMEQGIKPTDDSVQAMVAEHYAFISKFWTPTRQAYKSLAMSYILPSPYRDTYEGVAKGLGQYHYDAIVKWADENL